MKSNHFLTTLKGIFFSFILLSFIVGCSKKDEEEETPAAPTVEFSFAPVSPKVNEAVTFTTTSTNATSFAWSAAGTSFSSTEKNPTFTFTEEGDFEVQLVATGEGGSVTATRPISIAPADVTAPAPVAAFSFSPTSPEAGEEVTFTNESTNATSYQWSAEGTSFSSTEENPKFTFDTAGEIDVKLVATGEGGTNETTQKITVSEVVQTPPVAAFSFSPTSPQTGEEVTFTNESTNATSYQWSAEGTSFSSTEENPKFTFDAAGEINVKLVATGEGGTNEVTNKITVTASTPAPVAAFSFSPENPKAGEEVSFTNESTNATSYQWSAEGTSFSSTEENPKFTFDTDGVANVKLVVSNSTGTSETTTSITIAPASGGGGGNTNPCNLPECYIEKTTTTSSGFTTTVTYAYTTVNGTKLISSITTASIAGNLVTSFQYDAQGMKTRTETKLGGTLQNYTEFEYSNNNQTVRGNNYDAAGTLTDYTIDNYDANNRLVRTESYTAAGTLTGYTVFSNFLAIDGSFPQLNETFDANGTLTQRDILTYQDCQLIKTESTDGSGTSIGGVNNTIDARGLLRTSVATIIAGGTTIVSNSQYQYDCD
ncbi:PKD domain-containing protein [Bernardetia sp. ABR2-2B]|uniref:PKD domain-containing protein n=1 Tax=Bernardetia sp. ABR2-2B TaxID=3127472 RepID=UPI0030D4D8FF